MGYSQSMPNAPRELDPGRQKALGRWELMQNLFRMWRDFPELRFGQFLDNALAAADITIPPNQSIPVHSYGMARTWEVNLFYVGDYELECACFRFWVNHSGVELGPHLEKQWAEWIDK